MRKKITLISIFSFLSIIILTILIVGIVNYNNKEHQHKLKMVQANNATCTQDGNIEYYKCGCGLYFADSDATIEIEFENTIIVKTGHHCSIIDQQDATCTQDTILTVKCDECEYEYTDSIHALGHDFSNWVETVSKTCDIAAEETRVCQVCNFVETRKGLKLEHDYVLIDVYVIDDIELSKYECIGCNNISYVEGEVAPEVNEEVKEDLLDCPTDFSFVIYCEENEAFIKDNLRIYDAYFENTQYIDHEEVKMEYTVSSVDENYWLIKPVGSYQEGITYKVEANEKITLQDNNSEKIYFTTKATEIVELEGKDDNVIFLQNLENEYGGYFPYSVNSLDDSEYIYVELNSNKHINVGDTICVGDITSIADLINTNQDCYIGEVADIYLNKNGNYTLALGEPDLEKIFDNVNLAVNESINLDDEQLSDTLISDITNALYNDSEFISLIGSMDETAHEYASRKKLTSERVKVNNFFDNIEIKPSVKFNDGSLHIIIDGSFALNLYSKINNDVKVVGTLELQFKVEMTAGFDISINYKLKKFAGIPYGINYFDVALTQTNSFGFDFNVSINLDSDYELGYIKDLSKKTIHFNECKKAKSLLENVNSYVALSNEDAYFECLNSSRGCSTCKPFDNEQNPAYIIDKQALKLHTCDCDHISDIDRINILVKLGNINKIKEEFNVSYCTDCKPENPDEKSFKEKVIDKLQSSDWENLINKVRDYFGKTSEESVKEDSETDSKEKVDHKRIKLVNTSFQITIFEINFDIYLTLDFDIKASLSYKYSVETKTISGLRLQNNDTHTYKSVEKNVLNNELNILGDISFEIGLDAEVYLSFVGLSKYIQAGFSVEAGIYSELSGILHYDAVNNDNSYYAAYLEAGINLDINLYYKLFSLYGEFTIYENKFKLLEIGYDKVYYSYDNMIDDIYIDTVVDVNDYELFDVNYYDMNDNEFGVEKLVLDSNYYTVSMELEVGEYLYIDGNKIYTVMDAPKYFTDKLIINVTSKNAWNKYIKGSVAEFLEQYEINIIHDKTYNISLDNMGIGTLAVVENKHAVIPANLPVLTADGYTFAGWYFDKELTKAANIGDAITSDVMLYAKWKITLLDDNFAFNNKTVTYNGQSHSIFVVGDLPKGVTITYTNNQKVNAGEYIVTAHFNDSTNTYALPNDMTAVLTIKKADYDMSDISFDDCYTVFDGTVKSLFVSGPLSSDIGVSYMNNEHIEVGVYTVTARFTTINKNYNAPKDMVASLVIEQANYDMSDITFIDKEVTYNGEIQTLEIIGNLPDDFDVSYINNENINVGTYEVVAVFTSNSNNYMTPENMVAYITINKASYDMSGITFEDKSVVYNGVVQTLEVGGVLPSGLSVSYTNNNKINAGIYEVIASFINTNNNYNTPSIMKASLAIDKASYDMSGITFEDKNVVYNGEAQSLKVCGTLPTNVTVSYENNSNINVGSYDVVAVFETTDNNYNTPASMTATLTINKADYDMSGITFVNKNVVYNGAVQSLKISGTLPTNVTVSYENNSNINVGSYDVVAVFETTDNNYNTPAIMKAKLTINKAYYDMSGITFDNKSVVYNGAVQSLEVTGDLPLGVNVSYENNSNINAGQYEITAKFTVPNSNYVVPNSMKAILTINKADYDMSNVSLNSEIVIYDGNYHSLEVIGALPSGVSVTYENNSHINVGEYEVTAIFETNDDNYNTPNKMVATLEITRIGNAFDNVKFQDKIVTYNAQPQSIYVSTALPEGLSIEYTNNNQTNVGVYEVTAHFVDSTGVYVLPEDMTATLTIIKADYDMSGITFVNKNVVYNGEAQSLSVSGILPTNVTVSYENNSNINVGFYDVVAVFETTDSNYNTPASKTATLTINKADYDMSGITFDNKSVTYNGEAQSLNVSGTLPTNVTVSYENNSNINAGSYDVVAVFETTDSNYNTPASKIATLTINKADYDMSGITFDNKNVTYNGKTQSIEISGVLPTNVTVSYDNNSNINAGSYDVVAVFETTDNNYNTPASMKATLTINKAHYDMSGITFEDKNVVYNGEVQSLKVSGTLPTNVTVSYENNSNINAGSYDVVAVFETTDNNYNTPASKTAKLTINKADYDMSGITFVNKNVTYNGKTQSIEISGALPQGVGVSYTNNAKVSAGTYEITAIFTTTNSNYNTPTSKTAKLTINKADYDMSGITFENKSVTYNGKAQSLTISGILPSGLSVSYTNNSYINVGTYNIVVTFTTTNSNYNTPASKTAKLTINKADYDMSVIAFVNKSVTYNGKAQSIEISGALPQGVSVSYTNNAKVSAGTYEITATFTTTNSNYNTPASKKATLTINKANYDMSNVKFYNLTRVYTGAAINLYIEGTLPQGVSVSYTNNGKKDIGAYEIIATFTTTNSNYNTPASKMATLTIVNEIVIDSLKYDYLYGDYTAVLVGYTDTLGSTVNIPSTISYSSITYTVVEIAFEAFCGNKTLDKVIIPGSVKIIGDLSFEGCSMLYSVTISPGVEIIGDAAFLDCFNITSVVIPSTVKEIDDNAFYGCYGIEYLSIANGVERIGSYAFYDCHRLESVSIPASVSVIGDHAFADCTYLSKLSIASGVKSIGDYTFSNTALVDIDLPATYLETIGEYAFYNCKNLVTVHVGEIKRVCDYAFMNCTSLKNFYFMCADSIDCEIGNHAFMNCTSLVNMVIPGYVKKIGNDAFYGCTSLNSITLNEGVETIGNHTFSLSGLESIVMPDSLVSIGSNAFYKCESLSSVTLNNGLESIGASAFSLCNNLTKIVIPGSVKNISPSAFMNCSRLTIVDILPGVLTIGASAFKSCYSLTYLYLPSTLLTIGVSAFEGCDAIEELTIPDSVISIKDSAFSGCTEISIIYLSLNLKTIGVSAFSGCTSLVNVQIPNSVTSIGEKAFYGCYGLLAITLSTGITEIASSCFEQCLNLKSITIPNSVKTICSTAFAYCAKLETIVIPVSVTTIEFSAFTSCDSLKNVNYGGTASQWNNIDIDDFNTDLLDASINYSA